MPTTAEPPPDYPPPGMEVGLIERHARLKGRRILEIGGGEGRLTRQLAPLAASVVSIEPDPSRVKRARQLARAEGIDNITYRRGLVERVRLGPDGFDVVFFSWAL